MGQFYNLIQYVSFKVILICFYISFVVIQFSALGLFTSNVHRSIFKNLQERDRTLTLQLCGNIENHVTYVRPIDSVIE